MRAAVAADRGSPRATRSSRASNACVGEAPSRVAAWQGLRSKLTRQSPPCSCAVERARRAPPNRVEIRAAVVCGPRITACDPRPSKDSNRCVKHAHLRSGTSRDARSPSEACCAEFACSRWACSIARRAPTSTSAESSERASSRLRRPTRSENARKQATARAPVRPCTWR